MYLVDNRGRSFLGGGNIRLSTITGPVGSEVLTLGVASPSSSTPWETNPAVTNPLPQAGSAEGINGGNGRMLVCAFRNGSIWCAHHVFLPSPNPTHCAVQWWQLDPAGTVLQRGFIEGPGGAFSYAYPSLAVNKDDTVLIGFSRFAEAEFASAGYAMRTAGDPPNTMRQEVIFKEGEAPYFKTFGDPSGRNRWGDYSATVVDPLNDTDFWTIQEYAARPVGTGANKDRWGTWWAMVVPPPPPRVFEITSVTPPSANRKQTLDVTIAGDLFVAGSTVSFGDPKIKVLSTTVSSEMQIVTRIKVKKKAVPGPRTVTVTRPDATSAACEGCFTVN
jgi:hypothetical protein